MLVMVSQFFWTLMALFILVEKLTSGDWDKVTPTV